MAETSKNSQDGLTFTLGELLPGGGMDVLSNNQLLRCCDGHQQIAQTLQVDGRNYVVAPLDSTLVEALHFPSAAWEYGSLADLIQGITEVIRSYIALDADTLLLVAAYILSTWVPECVPAAPVLNVCGALGAESTLVALLSALCRRSLVVADASAHELCTLPAGLCPTVIATHPSKRTMQSFLAAAATAQYTLLRKGRLITSRHAAVLCTRTPLPAPALSIRLLPSTTTCRRVSPEEAQHLTDRLAPQLLHYRLSRHQFVSGSNFDCPSFCAESRVLSRVLGSVLESSPELQARLLTALAPIDEKFKVERSGQLAAVVVEALLALCREGKPSVFVEEITRLTNAILLGRHEPLELPARKVGAILREELGLLTQRRAHGYQLAFDVATQLRLEQWAQAYGVLTLHEAQVETDVHEVHDVHDVHLNDSAERADNDDQPPNSHDGPPEVIIEEQSA